MGFQDNKNTMTKPQDQEKPRPDTKATTKHRVAELKASGFSNIEIGKALNLHRDTIAKYLTEIVQKKLVLRAFRGNLGECLHADLLFGMVLKYKLLTTITDEDIAHMTVADKRQLLRDLSVSNGISYDKWRLQTGKSDQKSSHEVQVNIVHKQLDYYSTPEHLQLKEKADGSGEGGPAGMG
jgi:hypothetical protein